MSAVPDPDGEEQDRLELGVWLSIVAILVALGGWTLTDILGRLYL